MRPSRRSLLRGTLGAAASAGLGGLALWGSQRIMDRNLPVDGGYAAAADLASWERAGQLDVIWYVPTTLPLVALTFDDGPEPLWTPMVLDALDAQQAPATFFMVGRNVVEHRALVAGRLDRHEVGNHTWSHRDLAQADAVEVREELERAHDTIHRYLGREPTVMRPPYGHLGGAALLAASDMRYRVVLWSLEMHERAYRHDPQGQVRYIVRSARPGSIVLAHDVGGNQRLVTLRHLGEMISGLRDRGFRLVTVSELLAAATPTGAGPP